MKCEIRECRAADAEAVSELSTQLGYTVPEVVIQQRIASLSKDHDHVVVVACDSNGKVIGWMDLGLSFHLQSGRYCEIGGLVVAEGARGNGVGRDLVAYAERWGASKGVAKILVRSNAKRTDAHRFYLRENYEIVKTSAVFEKHL